MAGGELKVGRGGGGLRAGRSLHHAFVQFVNSSTRRVDIIWLNYSGFRVKYKTLLPRQTVDVNTFVGHPWIFRDSDSGDRMVVQLREVFEPIGWTDQEGWPPKRKIVDITIPVFSLKERCMQILRGHVSSGSFDQLDLPATLVKDLKNMGVSRNSEEPRTQNPG